MSPTTAPRRPGSHKLPRSVWTQLNPLFATDPGNRLLTAFFATLPKTASRKSFACHTCDPLPRLSTFSRPFLLSLAANLAPLARASCFQGLTTIKFSKLRVLITIRIARGWVYPLPAAGLKSQLLSGDKAAELNAAGGKLRQIVLSLLRQPAFCAASEDLRQAHSHFGGNAALPVHELGQRGPRDPERGSGLRDGEPQRLNALAQHKAAGMRGVLHGHRSILSVIVDIVHFQRVSFGKAKNNTPIGANGDGPKAFQVAFSG